MFPKSLLKSQKDWKKQKNNRRENGAQKDAMKDEKARFSTKPQLSQQ